MTTVQCHLLPSLIRISFQLDYTQQQAKDAGLQVKASKFPLAGNGRALSLNATEGFVRLITTKDDNVIVGAQVAGVNASRYHC